MGCDTTNFKAQEVTKMPNCLRFERIESMRKASTKELNASNQISKVEELVNELLEKKRTEGPPAYVIPPEVGEDDISFSKVKK